jgi:hypothetical protein
MRPLVRMFDSASTAARATHSHIHGGHWCSQRPTRKLHLQTCYLRSMTPSCYSQHLNRGHRARNEHRAASPTIHENDLKLFGAFREASLKIAAQLSGASKPPPAAAPCPGSIFAAIATCVRHPRRRGHSPTLERHAGSITGAAAQLETISAPQRQSSSLFHLVFIVLSFLVL